MIKQTIKSLSPNRTVRLAAAAVLMLGTLGVAPLLAQDAGAPPPPPQQGEGRPSPAERQARELDRMTHALNLTPDQVASIKSIQADGMAKSEAVRSDSTIAPADKRTKMMDLRKDEQAKIRAVLTPDQQPKFDTMMARQQERGGRGGPGGYGGSGGYGGPGSNGAPPPPPPPPAPPSL